MTVSDEQAICYQVVGACNSVLASLDPGYVNRTSPFVLLGKIKREVSVRLCMSHRTVSNYLTAAKVKYGLETKVPEWKPGAAPKVVILHTSDETLDGLPIYVYMHNQEAQTFELLTSPSLSKQRVEEIRKRMSELYGETNHDWNS